LIVLGCYALYSVGSALWSYRDCDDAAKSLQTVSGRDAGARSRSPHAQLQRHLDLLRS